MDTWSFVTMVEVKIAKQDLLDKKETKALSIAQKNNTIIINKYGIALVPTLDNKVAQLQNLFTQKIGKLNLIGRLIEVSERSPDSYELQNRESHVNKEKEPTPDGDVESFVLTYE